MTGLTIYRETGEFVGLPIVSLACSCGWSTPTVRGELEATLKVEMDAHWLVEHRGELAEMGLGPCGVCGRLTNRLRIRTELGDDAWLCDVHAPAPPLAAADTAEAAP